MPHLHRPPPCHCNHCMLRKLGSWSISMHASWKRQDRLLPRLLIDETTLHNVVLMHCAIETTLVIRSPANFSWKTIEMSVYLATCAVVQKQRRGPRTWETKRRKGSRLTRTSSLCNPKHKGVFTSFTHRKRLTQDGKNVWPAKKFL